MDQLLSEAVAGSKRTGKPEKDLLAAAAMATLQALAGQELSPGVALEKDEETDSRPLAPTRTLLDERYPWLLGEWLTLAEGKRIPPVCLPRVLDAGKLDRSVRQKLAAAGGPRALWLARCNPEWAYLLGESDEEEIWETGRPAARQAWFERRRRRDPRGARELLQKGWGRESAEDRVQALGAFVYGLSAQDEEFLERALDDRSRPVRRRAAQLLSTLPGSALGGRMMTRLAVIPPSHWTADMGRDSVEEKPPREVGEKAWWLRQIVALTPLAFWDTAAAPGDWRETLREGWIEAALTQKNAKWARLLEDPRLLPILSHEEQEKMLFAHPTPEWFRGYETYSVELGRFVLEQVREHPEWMDLLRDLGSQLPPELVTDLEGWAPLDYYSQQKVDKVKHMLRFRQAMRDELR